VVIPAAVRAALVEHARAEQPNEACGILLLRAGVADRYVPGRNKESSPYRFELELDPVVWADINDEDWEQAVVHTHLSSPAYPSRTDVENIGLWEGQPYVIYSVDRDELAAFRIRDGRIERVPLDG
jgi:[CysO sulfur-carrier protein]-S-L-cysteine hydrolase